MSAATPLARLSLGALAVVAAFGLYFSDNIRGYYRFKEACAKEGGLRLFEPIPMDVGWSADSANDARAAAQLKHVAFVRFVDKQDGKAYEVRYLKGNPGDDSSYETTSANLAVPVAYAWHWVSENVPGELRMTRSGVRVVNLATGRIALQWEQIGYSTFDPNRTLLAAPSGNACHSWAGIWAEENQAKYFRN